MDTAVETEVICPPEGATEFQVNGRTYRRSNSLSTRRYALMEYYRQALQYGSDPVEVFQTNRKAYELLNKQEFANAAVLIHGNMTAAARIADAMRDPITHAHPMVKLFCLFWNYEGEDKQGMDDEQMEMKVSDMLGVDVGFVFRQAVSAVPGLLAAYRLATEGFSPGEEVKDTNVSTTS